MTCLHSGQMTNQLKGAGGDPPLTAMDIGYTKRLVDRIKEQDTSLPWVQLGLICAEREIPVSHVSEFFGVTRQTVYNWFLNETKPQERYLNKIREAIEKLRKKSF